MQLVLIIVTPKLHKYWTFPEVIMRVYVNFCVTLILYLVLLIVYAH